MAKQTKLTSITEATAARFLDSAKERECLQCQHITGFHLMKTAKGGSWRWRYFDPTGTRRVATVGKYSTHKPEHAAAIALDWLSNDVNPVANKASRRQEAISAAQAAERRTLHYYLETHYSRHMGRWSERSAKENHQRISGHFANLLQRDMATITGADILEWQHRLEDQGRAYSTIRRIFSSLKTLLRQAVKDGVLSSDPLLNFSLDAPTRKAQQGITDDPKKSERRMLTHVEVQRVLTGLKLFAEEIRRQRQSSRGHGKPNLPDLNAVPYPHWFIPFCLLALHTGLRPGDIYSLTWGELNVQFGRLTKTTEKSKAQIRKGAKPAVVDMRLNESIKSALTDWWEQLGRPNGGLVFPSPRTNRQLDSKAHIKPWRHVKALGELPERLNFYCFRHHFISALVSSGVPLLAVAKLAGHKSVEMIQSHYGHLCEDLAAQAVDIVAASVTGLERRQQA